MSFREKTAWISLLALSGIYGLYFVGLLRGAPPAAGFRFGSLLETIVALVVVELVATTVVAALDPTDAPAPRDERERSIDLRATRIAYAGLLGGVLLACFLAAVDPSLAFGTNALLFILVTAEILRLACQIAQYRRDA
jgi:hypothetical protein